MDRQDCRRFYNVDQDYCQKICSMGGMFFLRIHHICQFSCTNQFLDWANFSSNFYTKSLHKSFPAKYRKPCSWQSERAGKCSLSSHQTTTQDTQIYKATKFWWSVLQHSCVGNKFIHYILSVSDKYQVCVVSWNNQNLHCTCAAIETKLRRTKLQAEQDQTFIELLVANLSAKNWKLVNCIKIDVKKDLLGVIPEKVWQ